MSPHIFSDIDIKAAIAHQPLMMAPSVPVIEMLRVMVEPSAHHSCVLVLEAEQLVGIVTERDAVSLMATGCNLTDLVLADVMVLPVVTLQYADFTDWAVPLRLFQQYRIRHLPVIGDHDQVLGVLTYDSLLNLCNPLEIWQRVETLEHKLSCLETEQQVLLQTHEIELAKRIRAEAILHSSQEGYQTLLDGASNAVAELTDRLELVLKSSQIGIWEWDVINDCLIWDRRMYEIYGIQPQDFVGNHQAWYQRLHPDDRKQFQPAQPQPRTNEHISHTEFRAVRPDGSIVAISSSAVVQYDRHGQPQLVVGMNIDITDRKRAEIGLTESQRFIQSIADASPHILYLYDVQERRNIYTNREIGTLLGYTPAEIQAMQSNLFSNMMHPEDLSNISAQYHQLQLGQDGEIREFEYRMKHANGEWRWLSSRNTVFSRDAHGNIQQILGTAADITDRKEYEQRLERSNAELLRATRLKDEFLANMSHELRTPLNAILGMSESLQEEVYGALNDQQKRSLAIVERSGQHLLELIDDILAVSKIEAGKLELNLSTVEITQLCQSSWSFITPQANRKGIQLIANVPADLGTIVVDERRLRQVLINLLNNAVKFTATGGRVTMDVYVEDSDSANPVDCQLTLCFAVSDTGIGIAANDLPKLFQPFTQIDSSLNRQYEGTGLGLTLVKQLVEMHGGGVRVSSTPGQGSCFTVCLPYC